MIQSVRIARFRTDVYASSNVKPSALRSLPAACASSFPFSERSTSFQPVKRFSLFHSLSPCRIKTNLCIQLIYYKEWLVVSDGGRFVLSYHLSVISYCDGN